MFHQRKKRSTRTESCVALARVARLSDMVVLLVSWYAALSFSTSARTALATYCVGDNAWNDMRPIQDAKDTQVGYIVLGLRSTKSKLLVSPCLLISRLLQTIWLTW